MMSEERARQMLVEYIERTKKSQSDVAKEMDVSPAYVSEFLKGTYKSPETAIPKIEQLLKINDKKEVAPREPGFQRTTVSGIVLDLIEHCHIQGKVGVAYGAAPVQVPQEECQGLSAAEQSILGVLRPRHAPEGNENCHLLLPVHAGK